MQEKDDIKCFMIASNFSLPYILEAFKKILRRKYQ